MDQIDFDEVLLIVSKVEMKWRWLRKDSRGPVERLDRESASYRCAETAAQEIAALVRGVRDGRTSVEEIESEGCVDLILDQLTGSR